METRRDAIPSPIMTTPEVAQYLRVHQGTLYKLIRRGQIPAFKIGTDYRFNRDAIEKLITDREEKGRPRNLRRPRSSGIVPPRPDDLEHCTPLTRDTHCDLGKRPLLAQRRE